MSKEHKKVSTTSNFIEYIPILASVVTGCVSISAFAYRHYNFCIMIKKVCAITAGIQKSKLVIKKNSNKHDKIVLLVKFKSSSIEVLISGTFIDLYVNQNEFVSVKNLLKEYDNLKGSIKNLKGSSRFNCRRKQKVKADYCKDQERKNNAFEICSV